MSRLSWGYWFVPRIMPLTPAFKYLFLAIIAALLVLAITTFVLQRRGGKNKKIFSELYYFGLGNFIIGFFLFFFRFEGTRFMTARYWLVLWFLGMIFWLYTIWKKFKALPIKRDKDHKMEEYLKYLPKKK